MSTHESPATSRSKLTEEEKRREAEVKWAALKLFLENLFSHIPGRWPQ